MAVDDSTSCVQSTRRHSEDFQRYKNVNKRSSKDWYPPDFALVRSTLRMRRTRKDKSSQWTNNGETLDTCQEHGGHIFPRENEFYLLHFKETNKKQVRSTIHSLFWNASISWYLTKGNCQKYKLFLKSIDYFGIVLFSCLWKISNPLYSIFFISFWLNVYFVSVMRSSVHDWQLKTSLLPCQILINETSKYRCPISKSLICNIMLYCLECVACIMCGTQ